jgi:hypothetical protein
MCVKIIHKKALFCCHKKVIKNKANKHSLGLYYIYYGNKCLCWKFLNFAKSYFKIQSELEIRKLSFC